MESVRDADIELTVKDRRKRHEEIRQRIKQRRQGQMADIRASTAKMWEDHAAGEDLVALLQTPGHGHSVMVQPEHPAPGHVYGATFVRIDEGRILKLRLPLDDGFESVLDPPLRFYCCTGLAHASFRYPSVGRTFAPRSTFSLQRCRQMAFRPDLVF